MSIIKVFHKSLDPSTYKMDLAIMMLGFAGLVFACTAIYSSKLWLRITNRVPADGASSACSKGTNSNDLQEMRPYQFPPLKVKSSTHMAMGLKRLDNSNWLTIDHNYLPEHALRLHLVKTCQANVIQALPSSLSACHEVLSLVVSFLTSRFPFQFTTASSSSGPVIRNHISGETFPIGPECRSPLEVAALLAMEDFNVLIKKPETGEYCLMASATLFPAGWKLQERIGTDLACLHAPVPGWKQKLGAHVNRYFDHLTSKTYMERTNLFVQMTPQLFQDEPEVAPVQSAFTSDAEADLIIDGVTVRRERQTFTRLPNSGAVLFTVRTYMTPLRNLNDEELAALRSQVWGWEEEIRMYKGFQVWGSVVEKWCEKRIGKRGDREPKIVGGTGCPFPV